MKRRRKKKLDRNEIHPEDIILDSSSDSDETPTHSLNRVERPLSDYLGFAIVGVFTLIALVFAGRSFVLQVAQGSQYKERSENNRLRYELIFSDRGIIYDRNGESLAWNEKRASTTLESPSKRVYKNVDGLAHILGYVDPPKKDKKGIYYQDKNVGQSGIEKSYDEVLSGSNGYRLIEEDANFQEISRSSIITPEDGDSIDLAIDWRLSSKLYEIIKDTSENVSFTGGAGIIMNVDTGEIIALTSYPEFDPNLMTNKNDAEQIEKILGNQNNPFLNRAVSGLYTPGSTIKPYVAAGVLEEGIIDPRKEILSTGSISVENPYNPNAPTIFRDWKAHGWVDLRQALSVSSNVYFFVVGGGFEGQRGLGIEGIERYAELFGFGSETGVDMEGESQGLIPNPKWKEEVFDDIWRVGDTYNTAIGQYGFQVTPLQLARSMSAIANGGYLVRPHLKNDTDIKSTKIDIEDRNIEIIHEGLRKGAIEGTASALNVPYVDIAAKTGTAELGISKKLVNSWVSGFFPYDDPQYAFVVVMERGPSSNLIGASSVARRLFDWMNQNTPEYLN